MKDEKKEVVKQKKQPKPVLFGKSHAIYDDIFRNKPYLKISNKFGIDNKIFSISMVRMSIPKYCRVTQRDRMSDPDKPQDIIGCDSWINNNGTPQFKFMVRSEIFEFITFLTENEDDLNGFSFLLYHLFIERFARLRIFHDYMINQLSAEEEQKYKEYEQYVLDNQPQPVGYIHTKQFHYLLFYKMMYEYEDPNECTEGLCRGDDKLREYWFRQVLLRAYPEDKIDEKMKQFKLVKETEKKIVDSFNMFSLFKSKDEIPTIDQVPYKCNRMKDFIEILNIVWDDWHALVERMGKEYPEYVPYFKRTKFRMINNPQAIKEEYQTWNDLQLEESFTTYIDKKMVNGTLPTYAVEYSIYPYMGITFSVHCNMNVLLWSIIDTTNEPFSIEMFRKRNEIILQHEMGHLIDFIRMVMHNSEDKVRCITAHRRRITNKLTKEYWDTPEDQRPEFYEWYNFCLPAEYTANTIMGITLDKVHFAHGYKPKNNPNT